MREVTGFKFAKKHPREKLLVVAGIPVNRRYSYENAFFKEGIPILEGSTFPLKMKLFKSGKIRLGGDAKVLGAATRSIDVRNLSYPGPEALD